jgi:hypothetical protein
MTVLRGFAMWDEFRDISEYKTAFSESWPQSDPGKRPWLDAHLEQKSPLYPSSEPVASLFHWLEKTVPVPRLAGFQRAREMAGEPGASPASPYVAEFRHSKSLDFGALDFEPA